MKEPLTVTICAYNHEAYIGQALDRLAEQTFKNFKIVACDDGSTDRTYKILKEYEAGKLAGKMKVVTHPGHVNRGIHHSINLVLEHVDTEFFFGQASDDFLEPDALEYLLGLLENDTSADFLYGQVNVVDEHGEDLFRFDGVLDVGSGLPAVESIVFGNSVRAPSMFFRAACKQYLLEVPPDLVFGDWYHNVFLFLEKRPLYYRRAVVNYRSHASNVSRVENARERWDLARPVFSRLIEREEIILQPRLSLLLSLTLQAATVAGSKESNLCSERSITRAQLDRFGNAQESSSAVLSAWFLYSDWSVDKSMAHFLACLPSAAAVRILARLDSVSTGQKLGEGLGCLPTIERLRILALLAAGIFARTVISAKVLLACALRSFVPKATRRPQDQSLISGR